ncbi:uncharacterized protein [Ptychodera flava]|uniref:uncharacterized protein n=1 Tax=Ptychodera flava TaxID=63121 RepID=UPI00396A51B4
MVPHPLKYECHILALIILLVVDKVSANTSRRCEPLTLSLCEGLGYSETMFPNILDQSSQDVAELKMIEFSPLIEIQCSPQLKPFLCYIYAPMCTIFFFEEPVPPCRGLCQAAKNGCAGHMQQFAFQWPDRLNCEQFPTEGLCIGSDVEDYAEDQERSTRQLTRESTTIASRQCEPLSIPLCQELGYSETVFPNFLNHDSQDEAKLEVSQFWPLIETQCSPQLKPLLCYIYAPVCTVLEELVPPCRGLCQAAKDGCEDLMRQYGFQWPDRLNCEQFPTEGLCLEDSTEIQGRSTSQTTTESTTIASRQCEPLTIPLCKGLDYSEAVFPNFLNHDSQDEAGLEVHQFWPLIEIQCSPWLKPFLCYIYAPVCTVLEVPVPPCRGLCQAAKDGCEDLMQRFGFQWPDRLNCELFPTEGLCLASDTSTESRYD